MYQPIKIVDLHYENQQNSSSEKNLAGLVCSPPKKATNVISPS